MLGETAGVRPLLDPEIAGLRVDEPPVDRDLGVHHRRRAGGRRASGHHDSTRARVALAAARVARRQEGQVAGQERQRQDAGDREPRNGQERGQERPRRCQPVRVPGGAAGGPASAARRGASRHQPATAGVPASRAAAGPVGRGHVPGRRRVHDHELERLIPAEAAAAEPAGNVDPVTLVDRFGEVAPLECDRVDDVEVAAKGQLGMAAGGGPDAGHGETVDADERVRVPRSRRSQDGEVLEEAVVGRTRREREVEHELGAPVERCAGAHEVEEARPERVPAVGPHLEAGRAPVPAVTDEEIGARREGGRQVVALGRPARGAQHVLQLGSHDGRAAALLGQAGRHEPDDAGRPGPAYENGGKVRVFVREKRAGLGDRRLRDIATQDVGGLEGRCGRQRPPRLSRPGGEPRHRPPPPPCPPRSGGGR